MNSSTSLRVQGDVKYVNNQQSPNPKVAILKFLSLVTQDTHLESEFSKVQILGEFQLTNDITIYGRDGETEHNKSFLYLVCQVRVWLVPRDVTIKREISTHLLLKVLAVRASLSELDSYYNPLVAHWQGIHYLLVWLVKGDRILISHLGILSCPQFKISWTGYALLLDHYILVLDRGIFFRLTQ